MYNEIKKINQPIESSGGVDEAEILKYEEILNTKFGYKYKQFLKEFGCLSIGHLEFYGICGKNDSIPSAIHATLELRKYNDNLPSDFIVIFELGDGTVYCIDGCDRVYRIDRHEIVDIKMYFDQFLFSKINEVE